MAPPNLVDAGLFTISQASLPKQQLEDFTAFQAALVVNAVAPPTLCALGVTGNMMTLLVLTCSPLRHTACCKYLAAVALTDSCILILNFCFNFVDVFVEKLVLSDVICKTYHFLFFTCVHLSAWLLVAVNAQRCFVVCRPMTPFVVTSNQFTLYVIGGLTLLSVFLNSHHLIVRELVWSETTEKYFCYTRGETNIKFLRDVWPWMDATLYCFLPAVCLIVLNTILVRTLKKAAVFRSRHQRHHKPFKDRVSGRTRRGKTGQQQSYTDKQCGNNLYVISPPSTDPLFSSDHNLLEAVPESVSDRLNSGNETAKPGSVGANCESSLLMSKTEDPLTFCAIEDSVPRDCGPEPETRLSTTDWNRNSLSETETSVTSSTDSVTLASMTVVEECFDPKEKSSPVLSIERPSTSVTQASTSQGKASADHPVASTIPSSSSSVSSNHKEDGYDRHGQAQARLTSRLQDQQDTQSQSHQLSLMPLLASLLFLILSAPIAVTLVVEQVAWERTAPYQVALYTLVRVVVNTLMYINHSINFLLYCFAGSTFRGQWYAIFCRCQGYCGDTSRC